MLLKVISPESIVYQGEVDSVTLPGSVGAFTVLKNHASLISTLVKGKITFTDAAQSVDNSFDIQGGIAEINENVISVCLF